MLRTVATLSDTLETLDPDYPFVERLSTIAGLEMLSRFTSETRSSRYDTRWPRSSRSPNGFPRTSNVSPAKSNAANSQPRSACSAVPCMVGQPDKKCWIAATALGSKVTEV